MHFDADDAVALAGFAAPALHVEAEASGVIATARASGHLREQARAAVQQAGMVAGFERGVRPMGLWSMSITRSMNSNPSHALDLRRIEAGEAEMPRSARKQRVIDQRGLARPGYARHAGEQAQRKVRRYIAQVVGAGAAMLICLAGSGACALPGWQWSCGH